MYYTSVFSEFGYGIITDNKTRYIVPNKDLPRQDINSLTELLNSAQHIKIRSIFLR